MSTGSNPGQSSDAHVAACSADLVRDAPRQQVERVDLLERCRDRDIRDQCGGRLPPRPVDHHLQGEARLLDPRSERLWQCPGGQCSGGIEAACTAAASLHALQNAEVKRKCQV